jgi:hypothetical protein
LTINLPLANVVSCACSQRFVFYPYILV